MNRHEVKEEKFLEFEKMYPPFVRNMETDLCTPTVAEGWEWCFNPEECYVAEKLDGTNVKLEVTDGVMEVKVRNQTTKGYIKAELNDPNYKYTLEGVATAVAKRSKRFKDGIVFGEVIGEKYQGNPYKMAGHLWVGFNLFSGGVEVYKDYPKTNDFEQWKDWVLNLKSLHNPDVEAEGVIFIHKGTGQMAKLRKDMFNVSYQPKRSKRRNK